MTNAKDYVAERAPAVEDWLTAHIESMFGRVVVGAPRYVSQFGIAYEEIKVDLDAQSGHESMMSALRLFISQVMPSGDLKTMTVVWRTKPSVYAVPSDFETQRDYPNTVRIRYRLHTLPTIDDASLEDLKRRAADREFGQPHRGHGPG